MINEIFEILNLNKENGLIVINERDWKGLLPQRTENIIENIIKNRIIKMNTAPSVKVTCRICNCEIVGISNINSTTII